MEFISHRSSSDANLYEVRSGEKTLLIEAGIRGTAIKKALGYRLSEVSGCLVSHGHRDHSVGVNDLIRAGIDCWMTSETTEAIGATGHRAHIIEPLKQFEVDGFIVLAFPTEHDCPGSVGFLIQKPAIPGCYAEKLLFITDSFYCRYRFKGVSIFAIECNYSEKTMAPDLDPARKKRLLTSHFSLENCVKFFQAQDLSKCLEIFLIHLSAENSDEVLFKKTIQGVTGVPVTVAQA